MRISLAPYIVDTSGFLAEQLRSNKKVLAEGAQGTLLDLDHGTYPFRHQFLIDCGWRLGRIGRRSSECRTGDRSHERSFQTRVGSGPFPTELSGQASRTTAWLGALTPGTSTGPQRGALGGWVG